MLELGTAILSNDLAKVTIADGDQRLRDLFVVVAVVRNRRRWVPNQ